MHRVALGASGDCVALTQFTISSQSEPFTIGAEPLVCAVLPKECSQ